MQPRDRYSESEELDFVPDMDELEGDESDARDEMQLLLERVQAARFAGA